MDGECTEQEGETLIWGTTSSGEHNPGQGAGNGVQSTSTSEGSAAWPQRWLLGVSCSVQRCWLQSHLPSALKSQKRHFRRLNFLATFSGGLRLLTKPRLTRALLLGAAGRDINDGSQQIP